MFDWPWIIAISIAAIGLAVAVLSLPTPEYMVARWFFVAAALVLVSKAAWWSSFEAEIASIRVAVPLVVGAISIYALSETLRWVNNKELASVSRQAAKSERSAPQGGTGGSGEIFGDYGTVVGGKGGQVGPGGTGRGGDGGGGIIHGHGGTIIGGDGGSVDGANIWYPPAQSGYIQHQESQGQSPNFGVQYPGAGGASGGWLERQQVVEKIREKYFRENQQEAKIQSSKIEDVPLEYINKQLQEYGHSWRAH